MVKISDYKNLLLISTTVKDGNMSLFVGEKGAIENRKKIAKKLEIDSNKFVVLYLQHKNKVYKATENDRGRGSDSIKTVIKADALLTDSIETYLFVLTADCLPISVYDPENQAIGLIHASRYNIDKIIKETIEKLINEFKTKPKNLAVNIGPSIGLCHYDIDLWKIAGNELKSLGVEEKNIFNQKICTFESDDYYSHRKAKTKNTFDNRFATVFGMR